MKLPVPTGQFKHGMRCLAGAVNIVTGAHAGKRHGMTATAVCSVSADPPTLLVCINRLARSHDALARSGAYCVNLLRAEDWSLSTTFSGAQTGEGRFDSREWTRLATGAPVLVDALVAFDCRIVKEVVHGSHSIFFGQVEGLHFGNQGKPLLYAEGQYAGLAGLIPGSQSPEWLGSWGF